MSEAEQIRRGKLTVIPAIDILRGRCVRLTQGSYDTVTEYDEDPIAVAKRFTRAGARRIHIVDLDGADGRPEANRPVIERIRKESDALLEVGGGIREEKNVEGLLEIGVDRLILGTVLAREPEKVADWVRRYGRRFIGGIDAREGSVRISGWRESTSITALDLASLARGIEVNSIIYTNISQDGMLAGPDIEGTSALARGAEVPVILSGGVSSLDDLRLIEREAHPLVVGAVAGKALYEGRIDPEELFREFPGAEGEVGW
ncbi:MAG: 1-(5-phosphoribosyl)-5-[(5-phosphoribosylamino)methylideneamino]imidazole-4-carboxamide isomerase [Spirochaetaceae bacterium]